MYGVLSPASWPAIGRIAQGGAQAGLGNSLQQSNRDKAGYNLDRPDHGKTTANEYRYPHEKVGY